MKITLLTSLCSLALMLTALGQTTPPPAPPDVATPAAPLAPVAPVVAPAPPAITPAPIAAPAATVAIPAATAAASADEADDLETRIEKKVKRGVHITLGDDDEETAASRRQRDSKREERVQIRSNDVGDGALMAIPIVGIIFTTLFGAPVMIVGVIMFFSYWKQRQLHRTVRLMVEKGQPVPEGLFAVAPASPLKQRSDMRRGVVLMMVGLALMIFFAAVNDWEGGAWAIGIIPFLIGCGYLLVWKIETGKVNGWNNSAPKASTDNPPPLP